MLYTTTHLPLRAFDILPDGHAYPLKLLLILPAIFPTIPVVAEPLTQDMIVPRPFPPSPKNHGGTETHDDYQNCQQIGHAVRSFRSNWSESLKSIVQHPGPRPQGQGPHAQAGAPVASAMYFMLAKQYACLRPQNHFLEGSHFCRREPSVAPIGH